MNHLPSFLARIIPAISKICFLVLVISMKANILELGIGWGKEYDENYNNRVLTLGLIDQNKIYRVDPKLFFSLKPMYSYWQAASDVYKVNHIASYVLNAKGYMFEPGRYRASPYLNVHFGPAWIAHKHFGQRHLGSHYALSTMLGSGIDIQIARHRILDMRFSLLHICNAGLASPNKAFNVPMVLQIGLLSK